MDVKTKDQRTGNAAPDRVEIADRACAEHGLKRCPHGIVPCLGYHSKFVHDSSERRECTRAIAQSVWFGHEGRNQLSVQDEIFTGRQPPRRTRPYATRGRLVKVAVAP